MPIQLRPGIPAAGSGKDRASMECCVRITAWPRPGTLPRVTILIVFIFIVVGVAIRAGDGPPDLTMLALGAARRRPGGPVRVPGRYRLG